MLIETGSHVPGVDPASFGVPSYAALRYEIPAPGLREFIADYHVLDSEPRNPEAGSGWMLPNSPAIRFILDNTPMSLAIGKGEQAPLPQAAFYGATSKAARMLVARGGITIGFNLTAVGFARLCGNADAARLRDTVSPLDQLLPAPVVRSIAGRLRDHDRGRGVKGIFDAVLPPLFAVPHPREADIRRVAALLARPGVADLVAECAAVGISQRRLERIANRFFGYPPQLLYRRARFLRSIVALKLAGPPFALADPEYHDQSHFIRSGHRFLGMTPLQFLRMSTPYLDSVLRARAIVHGASLAALDGGVSAS
jgi:hypothetical protein